MKLNYAIGNIIKYTGGEGIFRPKGMYIVVDIIKLSYNGDAIVHTKNIRNGEEGFRFYNNDSKVLGVAEYKAVKISD